VEGWNLHRFQAKENGAVEVVAEPVYKTGAVPPIPKDKHQPVISQIIILCLKKRLKLQEVRLR
jgi:hypothetical protein